MKRNGWLTPKKLRAVNSLVECSTVEEASREVGVSRSTLYEWLKVPVFQEEYERAKRRKYHDEMSEERRFIPKVFEGLRELAISSSNEQIRVRASVEYLKATGAYGAKTPLPFDLEEVALWGKLDQKGKITFEILERLLNGEMPSSEVDTILNVLDRLESKLRPDPDAGMWDDDVFDDFLDSLTESVKEDS